MLLARRAGKLVLASLTCVGRTIEGMDVLLCSARLANVAVGAAQVRVLVCIVFVPELTRWKRVAGEMLLARRAGKLVLASLTCVGRTIERMDVSLCSARLANVALGAA